MRRIVIGIWAVGVLGILALELRYSWLAGTRAVAYAKWEAVEGGCYFCAILLGVVGLIAAKRGGLKPVMCAAPVLAFGLMVLVSDRVFFKGTLGTLESLRIPEWQQVAMDVETTAKAQENGISFSVGRVPPSLQRFSDGAPCMLSRAVEVDGRMCSAMVFGGSGRRWGGGVGAASAEEAVSTSLMTKHACRVQTNLWFVSKAERMR
jgi:hypothetical protein